MSSGFVTEAELEEKRKLRQEEWEKVRSADQPADAPEEPYDHRSLFDRLEEQKQKKQMEYEEAHKLKNMIKGLDDDEIDFLEFVDKKKLEVEQLKELEEKQALLEFRKHVEKLKENSIEERLQAEIRSAKPVTLNSSSSIRSQHQLLKGVVVKRKTNEMESSSAQKRTHEDINASPTAQKRPKSSDSSPDGVQGGLRCVGILPGLGNYEASSDSESSSSSEELDVPQKKFDLLGRELVYQEKGEKTKEQH